MFTITRIIRKAMKAIGTKVMRYVIYAEGLEYELAKEELRGIHTAKFARYELRIVNHLV